MSPDGLRPEEIASVDAVLHDLLNAPHPSSLLPIAVIVHALITRQPPFVAWRIALALCPDETFGQTSPLPESPGQLLQLVEKENPLGA